MLEQCQIGRPHSHQPQSHCSGAPSQSAMALLHGTNPMLKFILLLIETQYIRKVMVYELRKFRGTMENTEGKSSSLSLQCRATEWVKASSLLYFQQCLAALRSMHEREIRHEFMRLGSCYGNDFT